MLRIWYFVSNSLLAGNQPKFLNLSLGRVLPHLKYLFGFTHFGANGIFKVGVFLYNFPKCHKKCNSL